MKHSKLYLTALIFASLGFTSCDDNWDTPPLVGPVATIEANTSIADLKAAYWQSAANCVDTIGYKNAATKEHYIIKGRVTSSDESGNIYKNLVIQDTYVDPAAPNAAPASLTLSINANSLYTSYRYGQEVVIDATDMYIGKYSGLQQLGLPDYSSTYGWQTTFMPLEFFKQHAQLNGLPQPEKVDTIVTTIGALPTDDEGIRKYQSQLVRFDGVHFVNGGKDTWASYQTTVSQNLTDGNATIAVRTSGYSNFYYETLPEGDVSIVGILGYFNNAWQLTVRDLNDCIFEKQSGTKGNPLTVAEAIAAQASGSTKTVWTHGYIVGAVAPGVSEVKSSSDIEWAAPFTLPNTLVIADAATERDYTKCIVIDLPQGSSLRTKANLADTPDNLGSEINLQGVLGKTYGMTAVTGNNGTDSEFVFSSSASVTSIDQNFETWNAGSDGYIDIADSNLLGEGWTLQTPSGNKTWSMRTFSGNVYATASGYKGTAPFDTWLITPCIDLDKVQDKVMSFDTQVNGYSSTTSKFEVYVMTSNDPSASTSTKLDCNIATAPASGYSDWVKSGDIDLSKFSGKIYIGFRYSATSDSNYATWCFDNVLVGKKSGTVVTGNDGSESKPYTATDVLGGVTGSDKWVTGYIVGYSSGVNASTSAKFTADGANDLNVLIAESASETDVTKCIAVGLPTGTIRTGINLKNNPGNLGKKVMVKGTLTTVYQIPGVNQLTDYKL